MSWAAGGGASVEKKGMQERTELLVWCGWAGKRGEPVEGLASSLEHRELTSPQSKGVQMRVAGSLSWWEAGGGFSWFPLVSHQ